MPDFNGLEIIKAHLFFKYFTITYRRDRKTNALYHFKYGRGNQVVNMSSECKKT